ncbi:hypothetical protein C8F04DRAFT_1273581 [Mycena alexandri]|uniref:Uncharacterized protein n=1 Tax=Mycena alexandri TaxID=1745969 RepID=A0AAD6S5D0_9AGAR|nr:hypothetical protein C8F04DRAFT_1273581 [Mycena alexandri]
MLQADCLCSPKRHGHNERRSHIELKTMAIKSFKSYWSLLQTRSQDQDNAHLLEHICDNSASAPLTHILPAPGSIIPSLLETSKAINTDHQSRQSPSSVFASLFNLHYHGARRTPRCPNELAAPVRRHKEVVEHSDAYLLLSFSLVSLPHTFCAASCTPTPTSNHRTRTNDAADTGNAQNASGEGE